MFTLTRGVFAEYLKKEEYAVLILGLDGAGKSTYGDAFKGSIDKTFVRRHPSKIMSTVGLNHLKVDCGHVLLNISEVGGHKDLRSLWLNYIDDANVIIFVIDGTDESRLDEALDCLKSLLRIEKVTQLPLLVLLNKCEEIPELTDDADGYASTFHNPTYENATRGVSNGYPDDVAETSKQRNDLSFNSSSSLSASQHHHHNRSSEEVAERIRARVFHFLDNDAVDIAILSVSALENLNVHKSVLWVLNAIAEQRKGANE